MVVSATVSVMEESVCKGVYHGVCEGIYNSVCDTVYDGVYNGGFYGGFYDSGCDRVWKGVYNSPDSGPLCTPAPVMASAPTNRTQSICIRDRPSRAGASMRNQNRVTNLRQDL